MLVIKFVDISMPIEIYKLIKGVTILKLLVFLVNLAVLWYLIRHYYKH
ncbi:DUF2127 domain-containing protein [Nostoc sp.]